MEIPYIVTPRKDTGLFNSKIAIWLFLASEVMLFGGFFSAYIFLRIGADYPWPERTLPVLPGLINTFILIASSVTVVFAWAALKLRNWRNFQIFMSITIVCAAVFMVLKGLEYSVKFGHQGVRLYDYSIVEGHLAYSEDDKGNKTEANRIFVQADTVTFSTTRYHKPWMRDIIEQVEAQGSKLVLASDVELVVKEGEAPDKLASEGDDFTESMLEEIQKQHLAARTHNQRFRTAALRQEFRDARTANPNTPRRELAAEVQISTEDIAPRLLGEASTVTFRVEPPAELRFHPRNVREGEGSSRLRDDTVISGELLDSPVELADVDAIDFQHLVMIARDRGIEPQVAIRNSWLMQNWEFLPDVWEKHQKALAMLEENLAKKGRVPTDMDRYRMKWPQIIYYATTELEDITVIEKDYAMPKVKPDFLEEFKGPNYQNREFPSLTIPRDQVLFESKFTPAWNTYYAIYFTITGIHGLHVIGGALVLAYYLFFGRAMYLSNPEWLANRVEVGGLFWHFVDLVWIFAFPIFYLM